METSAKGNRELVHPTFGVRDNCIGRALKQVISTICPVEIIQEGTSDCVEMAPRALEPGTFDLFLLDVQATSTVNEQQSGVLLLRPERAIVDLYIAIAENRPGHRATKASICTYFRKTEQIAKGIHDVRNVLSRLRQHSTRQDVERLLVQLTRLRKILVSFGHSIENDNFQRLINNLGNNDSNAINDIMQFTDELETRLVDDRSLLKTSLQPAPAPAAPTGYNTILAADDDGELLLNAWKIRLESLGYTVRIVNSLNEARNALKSTHPAVFVCDLGWQDSSLGGLPIIRDECLKSAVRLVVAMSSSRVPRGVLPPGAAELSGNVKSVAGAMQLHQLISERALNP